MFRFFGKKSTGKPAATASLPPSAKMVVIPEIFYGGANPTIYAETKSREHASSSPLAPRPVAEPKAPPAPQPRMGGSTTPPTTGIVKEMYPPRTPPRALPPRGKRKFFVVGSIALLGLIALGGISWYYLRERTPVLVVDGQNTRVPIPTETIPPPETELPSVLPPPTTTLDVPTTTPSLGEPALIFPTTFLSDSTDIDADLLTDAEEEIFGTDSGIWDTDNDGYYDGQEVVNLYNPRGFAPIRLIDSGLIREYINPTWRYRLYYPSGWEVAAVEADASQVLISTVSGDYVEVRVRAKGQTESFQDWFAREAVGQDFSAIQPFLNRFDEEGFRRQDGLVVYMVKERSVFVLVYHTGSNDTIAYRHVLEMVAQSFRPDKTTADIPPQTIIPPAPSVSTPPPDTSTVAPTTTDQPPVNGGSF